MWYEYLLRMVGGLGVLREDDPAWRRPDILCRGGGGGGQQQRGDDDESLGGDHENVTRRAHLLYHRTKFAGQPETLIVWACAWTITMHVSI